MIEKLFLSNFQGFGEHASTKTEELTLIFGPNGSGKSSIGRALRLMKQSANNSNSGPGHVLSGQEIDLGRMKNVVRGQLTAKRSPFEVGLGLSIRGNESSKIPTVGYYVAEDARDSSLEISVAMGAFDDPGHLSVVLSLNASGISVKQAQDYIGDSEINAYELQMALNGVKNNIFVNGTVFDFRAPDGYEDYFYDHFAIEHEKVDKFFQAIYLSTDRVKAELIKFRHIPPLRRVPKKYEIFENDAEMATAIEEEAVEQTALINELLLKITGGRYASRVGVFREPNSGAVIKVSEVHDLHTGAKIGFDQVGMGISQVEPIIADLVSGKGATYFEQPELHLHPKMQADLMDLFIDAVEENKGRQFFLETHSESMLLRLQKRIREGKIPSGKVKILFVDQARLDDGTRFNAIQELSLDDIGDFLDPLPVSFMDIRMQDLL